MFNKSGNEKRKKQKWEGSRIEEIKSFKYLRLTGKEIIQNMGK